LKNLIGAGLLLIATTLSSCAGKNHMLTDINAPPKQTKALVGMKENLDMLSAADKAFNSRNYSEATDMYEEVATKSAKDRDKVVMIQAMAMTARGHLIRDDIKSGMIWLQRAEKLAKDEEPLGWSKFLGVRGRFEWKSDNNLKATITFYEMYDYCIKHELFSRAIDAAHMVAITGTPEEQVEWAYKGIKAAELGKEDGWLGPLWNNLGATYWDKAESDSNDRELNEKALDCYLKARNFHWKMGSEKSKLIADWAVGSAYRRVGDFENAGAWLRAVLAWSERLYALDSNPDTGEWVGWSNYDLGLMTLEQGNAEDALTQLRIAREFFRKADIQKWDKKTWDLLEEKIVALEKG